MRGSQHEGSQEKWSGLQAQAGLSEPASCGYHSLRKTETCNSPQLTRTILTQTHVKTSFSYPMRAMPQLATQQGIITVLGKHQGWLSAHKWKVGAGSLCVSHWPLGTRVSMETHGAWSSHPIPHGSTKVVHWLQRMFCRLDLPPRLWRVPSWTSMGRHFICGLSRVG